VEEVVRDGVSGFVCGSVDEMVKRAGEVATTFSAANVRQYCQQYFSVDRMVANYVALYQELANEDSPLGKSTQPVTMVA
jgi:hypothetical protein